MWTIFKGLLERGWGSEMVEAVLHIILFLWIQCSPWHVTNSNFAFCNFLEFPSLKIFSTCGWFNLQRGNSWIPLLPLSTWKTGRYLSLDSLNAALQLQELFFSSPLHLSQQQAPPATTSNSLLLLAHKYASLASPNVSMSKTHPDSILSLHFPS
jgi:hypothetical protein